MSEHTPAEIARQTVKLLVSRRLQPTPENYQAIYEEVAKILPREAFPLRRMRHIASVLPLQTPVQKQLAKTFSRAVENQDWQLLQAVIVDYAQLELTSSGHATVLPVLGQQAMESVPPSLAEQLARLLEDTITVLGDDGTDARTRKIAEQLVDFLRGTSPPLGALEQMLHNYSYRLSFSTEDQAQRRRSIHGLLRMTVEYIRTLDTQDPPLQKQSADLAVALEKPWTLSQLDVIQGQLKSMLFRHLELHASQQEAHTRIKDLLANYAEHMAQMCEHSSRHQEQLAICAQRIQQTQNLGELAPLLQAVVESGDTLVQHNHLVHTQLQELRHQADTDEQAIHQLTASLQRMQDSSRHDHITGALNPQGLQETMLAEAERALHQRTPLSVAVLQIDLDVEQENALGAQVHELTLRHLAQVGRSVLRPQDALARTLDQRMVVVLPVLNTVQAAQVLAGLQNELAQRPLIHGDTLTRLSFSGGVIQMFLSETAPEALMRAVHACDQARQLGSGHVITG